MINIIHPCALLNYTIFRLKPHVCIAFTYSQVQLQFHAK